MRKTFDEVQQLLAGTNVGKTQIYIHTITLKIEQSKRGKPYKSYIITYTTPVSDKTLSKRFVLFSAEGKIINEVLIGKIFTDEKWLEPGIKASVRYGTNEKGYKIWEELIEGE